MSIGSSSFSAARLKQLKETIPGEKVKTIVVEVKLEVTSYLESTKSDLKSWQTFCSCNCW